MIRRAASHRQRVPKSVCIDFFDFAFHVGIFSLSFNYHLDYYWNYYLDDNW